MLPFYGLQGSRDVVHGAIMGNVRTSADVLPGLGDGQRFELNGVSLWAKVSGQGRPVLLMHGLTAHAYVWDRVAEQLAESLRVIAIDIRGHGRTGPAADGDYSAAAYSRDVAGLAEIVGAPLVVAGHSLGSRNAIDVAARHPGAVAGIVAIDYTPFLKPAVLAGIRANTKAGDRSFADADAVRAYVRGRYQTSPADAIERRARYGFRQAATGEFWPLADPQAARLAAEGLSEDLAGPLARVRVPAVLVRGAESTLVSPQAWRRTRELRPDLPAVEVEGTDHQVVDQRPDVVAGLILDLVDRLDH